MLGAEIYVIPSETRLKPDFDEKNLNMTQIRCSQPERDLK